MEFPLQPTPLKKSEYCWSSCFLGSGFPADVEVVSVTRVDVEVCACRRNRCRGRACRRS